MYKSNQMTNLFIRVACIWLLLGSNLHAEDSPDQWAKNHLEDLLYIYTDIHSNPELSFHEQKTAATLNAELQNCGIQTSTDIGGYGVVGIIENGSGPVVMLRADLDALPITEQTGLPFASKVRTIEGETEIGVMHACGHDAHTTILIGTACYLAEHKPQWQGTLMLVGQPAEEKGAGAKAMLEDGLFERFPKPDFAIGLHVSPIIATGKVGYRSGFAMANVDSVNITIHGKGGHGAHPHTTIDPIVQASQLVLALQAIVSREIEPVDPAVITVGSIHGGTTNNVIPDNVKLQLTVRSFSDEVRQHLLSAIERKAKAVALSNGAPEPLVEISRGTPSLYNDPRLAARMRTVLRETLGRDNIELAKMSMGGEDFSRYGRAGVPILMYWLGAVSQQRLDGYKAEGVPPPSLHSPLFYPDAEATLVTGVNTMSTTVLELLKPSAP